MELNLTITKRQKAFIDADATEVLFGGAAGGGKSYGQLTDALLYALKYAGSRQLILRRTFPELERSLISVSLALYPSAVCKYQSTKRKWFIKGGSVIEFGYCDAEKDVYHYQGAEYDVVRFDELTHFTQEQYLYLLSRVRGVNSFPKAVKSTANPGGIGHAWVKQRFIDGKTPDKVYTDANGHTTIFIPSFIQDNHFLMESDPLYLKRLEQLPDKEKKALLYGDWNIFEGQVFSEWRDNPQGYLTRHNTHVIRPFQIPKEWRRFRAFDFGYAKPFAVTWFAVDHDGRAYLYRELYGCTTTPDTGIKWTAQQIAKEILKIEQEHEDGQRITGIADPAIWNATGSEEGSIADMMQSCGVYFEKGKNNRLAGKMQLHYRLAMDSNGLPMMYVFQTCRNTIRTLPLLTYDPSNPEDVDTRQEDHIYDTIKYFLMANPISPRRQEESAETDTFDPLEQREIEYQRFVL